jgi:hypothetical protein
MASTAGNGSTFTKFNGGNVLPQNAGSAAGFIPGNYASKGGKKQQQQQGGALAFSELKGGKKKRSRKTSRKSSKKTSNKLGKKTMKNMLKGIFGVFKK